MPHAKYLLVLVPLLWPAVGWGDEINAGVIEWKTYLTCEGEKIEFPGYCEFFAQREALEALEKRVKALEKRVEALEAPQPARGGEED